MRMLQENRFVRFFSCLMDMIEELWPSCSAGNCALTAREDSLERALFSVQDGEARNSNPEKRGQKLETRGEGV